MSTVCEIRLDVEIVRAVVNAVLITSWDNPSLDNAIITSRAQFWLSWTTASSEDDGAHNIEMASQPEPDFEAPIHLLRVSETQFCFNAFPPRCRASPSMCVSIR
jgi:hypothetical protein